MKKIVLDRKPMQRKTNQTMTEFQGIRFTLNGCVKKIDDKKLMTNESNHFWIFASPNSIPSMIVMKMEMTPIRNANP